MQDLEHASLYHMLSLFINKTEDTEKTGTKVSVLERKSKIQWVPLNQAPDSPEEFRNLSFYKTISSLTDKKAILLSFSDESGQIKLHSGGTPRHFVKYRLGEDGINEVMFMLGEKILKLSQEKEEKIDSTPLEAFKKMNADLEFYSVDGGYDSFLNHSDIWYHLNAKPIISYASDAVIKQEGEEERIDHWVNKKWKLEGDIHAPMENKLKFLYEIGRKEQVGMYLRNQNIRDESFDEQYKKRTEYEKTHGHIKGTVKFDIRRVRNVSRKLYSLLSFISYQLLVLTELQNKVGDKNSAERNSCRKEGLQ